MRLRKREDQRRCAASSAEPSRAGITPPRSTRSRIAVPTRATLHLDGPVKVGFRRLSIIDLRSAANQPMLAADGATWLVFNGEDLRLPRAAGRARAARPRLPDRLRHRGRSATRYLEWGDDFVDQIDGMFAIVIWDAREQRLKLYRDRPGIKPLYYFHDGRRVRVRVRAQGPRDRLRARASLQVDATALYDFLSYRYVPAPKTLYKHCFKLPPAHGLSFDPATGAVRGPHRYLVDSAIRFAATSAARGVLRRAACADRSHRSRTR